MEISSQERTGNSGASAHNHSASHSDISNSPQLRSKIFTDNLSSAFLSSLGANLRIPDSDLLPSPLSTPPSLRASADLATALPPPSPLAFASMPPDDEVVPAPEQPSQQSGDAPSTDPLDGVPPLTTYVAESAEDKVAALKLVTDSIAQQRQMASRILISHPLNIAVFGAILALAAQWFYKGIIFDFFFLHWGRGAKLL